jgi:pimeloyl-ACP methyl ester carboxylesterase
MVRRAALCLTLVIVTAGLSPGLAQQPAPPAGQPARPNLPATQPPAKSPTQPPAKPPTRPPTAKQPVPAKTPSAKPKPEEEEKPPAPESSYLRTKDGWSIYCTYYAPKEEVRSGKQVVPVILLHDWEGQGGEYSRFAVLLQTFGCAVMVPDLRGHGRSTSVRRPDPRTGELRDEEVKFDDTQFSREMGNMVLDVEAVKKELMELHNKAELNIELLCVGGAGVGAIVAVNWAAMDWSWPITPSYKQGQDVKGLILLSPRQSFKGLNATQALSHPAIDRQLSAIVAVGKDEQRAYSDAKRVYKRIEQGRETYTDPAEQARSQTCFFYEAPTTYQGTKLLEPQLKVYRAIGSFLKWRLFDKVEEYPWAERKSPLQ